MITEENVQAYPLQWPVGRPRTDIRSKARFQKSATENYKGEWNRSRPLELGEALKRLADELRLVRAINPIVSSNVPTRGDGMPYSKARMPDDPGVAVYFRVGENGKTEAVCLSCDRWDRIADNVAAIAKHISAMRGMERWGVGSMAQMFSGFKALPAATIGADGPPWYQVLGLGARSTPDVVKERYHRLAQEHHPDRGGNAGTMAAINRAYEQFKERWA